MHLLHGKERRVEALNAGQEKTLNRFGKWAYDSRTKTLSHSESAWKRSLKNITHSHSSGFSTVSLPASVSSYRLKLPRHQTPNPVGVVPLAQGIALGSDSRRLKHRPPIPAVPNPGKPPMSRRRYSSKRFRLSFVHFLSSW